MNRKYVTVIGLILLYLIMPILLGCIVARAVMKNNGAVLVIVFAVLIILSLSLSIFRFIKHKRD